MGGIGAGHKLISMSALTEPVSVYAALKAMQDTVWWLIRVDLEVQTKP